MSLKGKGSTQIQTHIEQEGKKKSFSTVLLNKSRRQIKAGSAILINLRCSEPARNNNMLSLVFAERAREKDQGDIVTKNSCFVPCLSFPFLVLFSFAKVVSG